MLFPIALALVCCGNATTSDADSGRDAVGADSDDLARQDAVSDRTPAVCPPPEPYGYEVGAPLHDLSFLDCDGLSVGLHDLCGADAGLVFNFYGWCTGCYRFLEEATSIWNDYREQGLRFIVVIDEDPVEEPATQEYCTAIRDRYELAMSVVIDPDNQLEAYGEADLAIVTDEGARIVFKRSGATVSTVRSAIERELDVH